MSSYRTLRTQNTIICTIVGCRTQRRHTRRSTNEIVARRTHNRGKLLPVTHYVCILRIHSKWNINLCNINSITMTRNDIWYKVYVLHLLSPCHTLPMLLAPELRPHYQPTNETMTQMESIALQVACISFSENHTDTLCRVHQQYPCHFANARCALSLPAPAFNSNEFHS